MVELKSIELKKLGVKEKVLERLNDAAEKDTIYNDNENFFLKKFSPHSSLMRMEKAESKIMTNNNFQRKFLTYVNIIEDISENKEAFFYNYQALSDQKEKLDDDEFAPKKDLKKETIPLTFKKYFYRIIEEDITKLAVDSPNKLQNLIEVIRTDIQNDAFSFLEKQVKEIIYQVKNYANEAIISKTAEEFQKSEQVLRWIIRYNLLMQYNSSKRNKDQLKINSDEKGQLLIIDASLYQQIEIDEYHHEKKIPIDDKKIPQFFPLPLYKIWEQFAGIIITPLENNFKFIILDKRSLVGWYKFQKLEIKYDEKNQLTYFLRNIRGGFSQLTYFNACVFTQKN